MVRGGVPVLPRDMLHVGLPQAVAGSACCAAVAAGAEPHNCCLTSVSLGPPQGWYKRLESANRVGVSDLATAGPCARLLTSHTRCTKPHGLHNPPLFAAACWATWSGRAGSLRRVRRLHVARLDVLLVGASGLNLPVREPPIPVLVERVKLLTMRRNLLVRLRVRLSLRRLPVPARCDLGSLEYGQPNWSMKSCRPPGGELP